MLMSFGCMRMEMMVRTLSGESKGSTDTSSDDDDQHGVEFDGDVWWEGGLSTHSRGGPLR